MSNETLPNEQSPKSALITDNEISFQSGAPGVSLRGVTHTVISRNKFIGLGGEGLVIDVSEGPSPPPPLGATPQPEPLPTLQPEPEPK